MPVSILLGCSIAIALNQQIRLIAFYRTCIFVPFVASAAATGILASYVFNPQFGVANERCCAARACRRSSSWRTRTRPCW